MANDKLALFNARQNLTWSWDRLYRVYCDGENILLIRIGGQRLFEAQHLAMHLGLIGGLIAAIMENKAKPPEDFSEWDEQPASELMSQHKHNVAVAIGDVLQCTLDPPATFGHGPNKGRWSLVLKNGEKMSFQFEDLESMHAAVQTLPKIFGDDSKVHVVWDAKKERYRKV